MAKMIMRRKRLLVGVKMIMRPGVGVDLAVQVAALMEVEAAAIVRVITHRSMSSRSRIKLMLPIKA